MSHLSFETIARLVDEQPSPLDNAHLESCAACRSELEDMRRDVASLGALPDMEPAPDAWTAIEARLEAEGLLRRELTIGRAKPARSYTMLARAAAVAAIFLGGALVGHALRTAPPVASTQTVANTDANASSASTDALNATPDATAPAAAQADQNDAREQGPVRLASTGNATRENSREPATTDEALRDLRSAEDKYFASLSKYAEKSGTVTSDPTTQLAAIEGIIGITRAALAQAPADAVINGYHLTALAQRDALLKKVRATPATSW